MRVSFWDIIFFFQKHKKMSEHTYNEINLGTPVKLEIPKHGDMCLNPSPYDIVVKIPPLQKSKREYVNYLVEEIPGGRARGFEDKQELIDFLWNFQFTPRRTLHIKYFGNEQKKSGEDTIQ